MKQTKDKWVMIRVTEEEKAKIRKDAEKLGLSISTYLRFVVLGGTKK